MKEEDRAVDEDNVGDSSFAMRTGRDCPPGDWRWGLRNGGGQSRHVNGPSRGPGKVQSYALTRSLEDPWAEPLTVPLPLKARCASLLPEPGGKSHKVRVGFTTVISPVRSRREGTRWKGGAERPNLDATAVARLRRRFRTAVRATKAEHSWVCLSVHLKTGLARHILM